MPTQAGHSSTSDVEYGSSGAASIYIAAPLAGACLTTASSLHALINPLLTALADSEDLSHINKISEVWCTPPLSTRF